MLMENVLDTTTDFTPCVIPNQGASIGAEKTLKEIEELLNSQCKGKDNDSIQTISSS